MHASIDDRRELGSSILASTSLKSRIEASLEEGSMLRKRHSRQGQRFLGDMPRTRRYRCVLLAHGTLLEFDIGLKMMMLG